MIAKLVDLARRKNKKELAPSLARLCAEAVVKGDPVDYQKAGAGEAAVVSDQLLKNMEGQEGSGKDDHGKEDEGYAFDAYLCMLKLVEYEGEGGMENSTTGSLVPLCVGDPTPPSEFLTFACKKYSYSWGKRTLRAICQAKGDLSHDGLLEFNDSYFSDEDEDVYPFFRYQGGQHRADVAPGPDEALEDLLVFANELLYADPTFYRKTLSDGYPEWWGEASNKEDNVEEKKKWCSGSHQFNPSKVEFLGNGGCSPGRWYSRAALVLWPKQHRKLVRETTHGALREAQDIENGQRAEARKAKALASVAGAVVQASGAGLAAAAGAVPP